MARAMFALTAALLWSGGVRAQSSDAVDAHAGGNVGQNAGLIPLAGAPPLVLPTDAFVTSLAGLGATPIGVTPLAWCAES